MKTEKWLQAAISMQVGKAQSNIRSDEFEKCFRKIKIWNLTIACATSIGPSPVDPLLRTDFAHL